MMILLAIDPGRDKCGYAILDNEKKVYEKGITPTSNLVTYLKKRLNKYSIALVVLGDGTFSDQIKKLLLENFKFPVKMINETNTTFEAEKRYRQEKLKGWERLLSFVTWKPAEPVDDYVAVLLGERFLEKNT